ncbi:MAG: hypothetical protein ACLQDY_27360 [Streptosporangiaceae bacterium]
MTSQGAAGRELPVRPAEPDFSLTSLTSPRDAELAVRGETSPALARLPEFEDEIRLAVRNERGLVLKAAVAVALVAIIVLARLLWLG